MNRQNTDGRSPAERKAPRTAWKPGQSGNLGGRPKGTGITQRIINLLGENDGKGADAFVRAGVQAALSGDYRFWEHIYNRVEGKIPERLAGHDGGPLVREVVGISVNDVVSAQPIIDAEHVIADPRIGTETAPD